MRKGLLFFSLVLSLLLSGCSDPYAELSEEYNLETDYPQTFYTPAFGANIAPAENGYYFQNGSFIYYMDYGALEPVVLCSKPECRHENESNPEEVWKCAGFVSPETGCEFLQYYEGNLYVIGRMNQFAKTVEETSDTVLFRINAANGTKEVVRRVNCSNAVFTTLHRGYLYQYYADTNGVFHLVQMSITSEDPGKELFTSEAAPFSKAYFFGNGIFISSWYVNDDGYIGNTVMYDLKSGTVKEILSDVPQDQYYAVSGCIDGKVLLQLSTITGETEESGKVFLYDAETDTCEQIGVLKGEENLPAFIQTDGSNLMAVYENAMADDTSGLNRRIEILNDDFTTEKAVSIASLPSFYGIASGDENCLFIWYSYGKDGETYIALDVVDKVNNMTVKTVSDKAFAVIYPPVSIPASALGK